MEIDCCKTLRTGDPVVGCVHVKGRAYNMLAEFPVCDLK